ncbi:unnamed protein product, partial [Mesorhabditis spiculigera]
MWDKDTLARQRHVHPERLYVAFAQACGELVTFTDDRHLPEEYPAYQHDQLRESFKTLEETLRRSLGTVLQPRAVSLPIVKQEYGVQAAALHDRRLLENAEFILAVRAKMPPEQLRQQFLQQTEVSSTENLRQAGQFATAGHCAAAAAGGATGTCRFMPASVISNWIATTPTGKA